MCVNHPETIPTSFPVCGKIIFHKIGPWWQKDWGWFLFIESFCPLPAVKWQRTKSLSASVSGNFGRKAVLNFHHCKKYQTRGPLSPGCFESWQFWCGTLSGGQSCSPHWPRGPLELEALGAVALAGEACSHPACSRMPHSLLLCHHWPEPPEFSGLRNIRKGRAASVCSLPLPFSAEC